QNLVCEPGNHRPEGCLDPFWVVPIGARLDQPEVKPTVAPPRREVQCSPPGVLGRCQVTILGVIIQSWIAVCKPRLLAVVTQTDGCPETCRLVFHGTVFVPFGQQVVQTGGGLIRPFLACQ